MISRKCRAFRTKRSLIEKIASSASNLVAQKDPAVTLHAKGRRTAKTSKESSDGVRSCRRSKIEGRRAKAEGPPLLGTRALRSVTLRSKCRRTAKTSKESSDGVRSCRRSKVEGRRSTAPWNFERFDLSRFARSVEGRRRCRRNPPTGSKLSKVEGRR